MYLLIDSVSDPIAFVLFSDTPGKVSVGRASIRGKEFDTFLESLESFLAAQKTSWESIEGIFCISGPAQFTSIRIISLTMTTLARSKKIKLYTLDYFSLAEICGAKYPMLVNANREEVVEKSSQNTAARIVKKTDLTEKIYFWSAKSLDFANEEIRIQSDVLYELLSGNKKLFEIATLVKSIDPYYLKKPNIT